MVGCFGLCDDHHHTRVPHDLIVEANPRLDVWMLLQCGGLVENATTWLQWGEKGCLIARRTPDIWIDGTRVPVTWDEPMPGVRLVARQPFSPHWSRVVAFSASPPHCRSIQTSRRGQFSTRRSSGKWNGLGSSRSPKQPTMVVKPKHARAAGQGQGRARITEPQTQPA